MPKSPVYVPGQEEPYKISRAKIEDFIRCPRCFVLDSKHGVKRPRSIPFTLNNAVDSLLKKEFDVYRSKAEVLPIVAAAGLDLVPFTHPALDKWRENFTGIRYETEDGRFLITGEVDDIWVDRNGVLTVVDYKATGRPEAVTHLSEGGFNDSYRRQLEIYQWLTRYVSHVPLLRIPVIGFAQLLQQLRITMNVTRPHYFDKWRGETCTTVNGKKAFRPGVGWK
jgi:ATP-dependent exoDNAse (exonuclease V) beta subunit